MSLIFGVLLILTLHAQAKVQLAPPLILDPPAQTSQEPANDLEKTNMSTDSLLKAIEGVVSPEHPEMFARWQKYLRAQNLDPDNEDRTLVRLQKKYLDSIHAWGQHVSECDSTRSSSRWLRRLRRKYTAGEINYHKKDIAKIITSLYLKRKNECMQSHEEIALRAEREIYSFSLERTRLLIDFVSQNSQMHISQMNKFRLLSAMKRKQNAHTLSDRSVDLNSLRLETKLQNLPKDYVEFLSHEQSFKKPFDLHKNLSLLSSEYSSDEAPKKARLRKKKNIDLNISKTTS